MKFITKYKKQIVIVALVFVVTYVLYSFLNRSSHVSPPSIPAPTPLRTATPIQLKESRVFEVLSVYPGTGVVNVVTQYQALGVRFSRPLYPGKTKITLSPNIELRTSENAENNIIYVQPVNGWSLNTTYNITVTSVSTDEESLTKPYEFTFTPTFKETTGLGDEHSE